MLACAAVLVAATACGGAFPSTHGGRVYEFVIPPGTARRIAAGERVSIMPANLHIRVGDRLRIVNHDTANQWVGPYYVEPGQTFEIQYRSAGTFTAVCNLANGKRFNLVVST